VGDGDPIGEAPALDLEPPVVPDRRRAVGEMDPAPMREARTRLSMLYKRAEQWAEAMALWEQAAGEGEIYAFVELAKVYEHKKRDFPRALGYAQGAIETILTPGFPLLKRFEWKEPLLKRKNRLESKIRKSKSAGKKR